MYEMAIDQDVATVERELIARSGDKPCTVSDDGWHCCLVRDHLPRGKAAHEAWTGTPLRLCRTWH